MANTVRPGAKSPEYIVVTVSTTADSYVTDLSTVTAARLRVRKPSGAEGDWTASITAQSATGLTLKHTFDVAGAEADEIGRYCVQPFITTPDGEWPCSEAALFVGRSC